LTGMAAKYLSTRCRPLELPGFSSRPPPPCPDSRSVVILLLSFL
jgi:hypothetical protein